MAMIEITIFPIGTGSTSISEFVAGAYKIIENSGLSFELTPTSTVIEGNIDKLFQIAKEIHESPFRKGAKRVVTSIMIDDRRDKTTSMEYKKESVLKKQ